MTEVPAHRFDSLSEELQARIETVLGEFAQAQGQVFDLAAMGQGHCNIGDLVRDTMTFGMDIWPPCDTGDEKPVAANVVLFEPRPEPKAWNVLKLVGSTVGAIAATTIVAAATTDAVNLPYLPEIIDHMARHNPPDRAERIVENNGRLLRVTYARKDGDRLHRVVIQDIEVLGTTDTLDLASAPEATETTIQ